MSAVLDPGASGASLSLVPVEAHGKDADRSRLLVDGVETGRILEGLVLEAVRRTDFGTLVLVTEDCPYEEILHAYLLDDAWRVLDRVSLGAAYSSGWLHDLEDLDANTFRFRFFGDADEWTLAAHAPRWRLHPLACTFSKLVGPVTRPVGKLCSRSSLLLKGSYLNADGRRLGVRS